MAYGFKGRREDKRLLTGRGRYTADWDLPGQAHAAFLRSDRAHAAILRLDAAAARAAPGVLAVLTGQDAQAAGFDRGRAAVPFKGRDGAAVRTVAAPALAWPRARYVGEPVALVVAETAHQAQDAAELIEIEWDDLPALPDAQAALAPGAPPLHDDIAGNVCFDFEYGDAEATARAFAGAAHVVRAAFESGRVVGNPMEPKAALACWTGDVLELWCPSQGLVAFRDGMAAVTGLTADRVRPHAWDVGGAFGIRGAVYPEYAALALAARQAGRPVKWVASRSETFLSDYHGRDVSMVADLALDAEGTFLAIRHTWTCNIGAYPSAAGPLTNCMNAATMAFGAYRIGAVSGRSRQVVTNTVPITAYRGAGRPDMAYAVERLVDEAAAQTGFDRVALRRRNLIPRDAFPYPVPASPAPSAYDSADFAALLDAALHEADWAGFAARRGGAAARGRLRGIGCALFIEPAGGAAATDEMALTFAPDGGILMHEAAVFSGQGHETVLPELAARVLQIEPEHITLLAGRPDGPALKGIGAFGSRSTMAQGSLAVETARVVIRTGMALASDALEAAVADLEYANGAFRVAGTDRSITLFELARRTPGALDSRAALPSPRAFPSGAHVAEVEVDPDTGETELVRYVSIDDCGAVINQTLIEGQIWGGLMQGLGQVFGEHCRYDEAGQMLTGSFMDYAMPHAGLANAVTIKLLVVPSPGNQLGTKGVGEAGTVGSLPTTMNAMLDALRPAGVTRLDMPATAQHVWGALQAARMARAA